jgi:hypothetical protein
MRAAVLMLIFLGSVADADESRPTYTEFLDNGVIRVGIETKAYGGAITYVSVSGETRNLVNNHDRGRQIQQSYYAGESLDRQSEGQSKHWSPWPWNPIQVGDTFGNSAKVVKVRNSGRTIYVKTVPLLWDMENETAECEFETWVRLHGNTAHVRNRLTVHRTDERWGVRLCSQELPAVYSIGDLHRLMTYAGPAPFSWAPVNEIENNGPPWASFGHDQPTEKWAALVDEKNWGLGVYNAKTELFTGGFHGKVGGEEFDDSTGYVSPLRTVALEKRDRFSYEYDLIVGTVDEIRAFAYAAEGHKKKVPGGAR